MKRNHTKLKNTEKTMNAFRKIFVHAIMLCLMITVETIMILKMKSRPENVSKVTQLLFLTATVIPAMMYQSKNSIYDNLGYYLGIFLVWSTIGVGFFDWPIGSLLQIASYIFVSFAVVLAAKWIVNGKKVKSRIRR